MSEELISLDELATIVKRNIVLVLAFAFLGLVISYEAVKWIPKRYKSTSSISVQGSYFKNPLVNDLVAEEYDTAELRAQRGALFRMALPDEFIEELGREFKIFKYPPDSPRHLIERKLLREDITYYSMDPSTYSLSIAAGDPAVALGMTQRVLDRIVGTLVGQRLAKLTGARETIKAHVEKLGVTLKNVSESKSGESPALLQQELNKVRADLTALLVRYTEKHPEVFKLKQKERSITSALAAVKQADLEWESSPSSMVAVTPQAGESLKQVYDDLLKKLSYLNIILDIEKSSDRSSRHIAVVEQPSLATAPFYPNKKLFVGFGALAGLALAFVVMVWRELRIRSLIKPEDIEELTALPHLGALPMLPDYKRLPAVSRKSLPGSRARLALPARQG